MNFCFSEHFFRNVHPKLAARSASTTTTTSNNAGNSDGATKCPFRAMLQQGGGRGLHSAPPLTGAPQTMPVTSAGEMTGGRGPEEGSDCKCVSSGKKPKGTLRNVIMGYVSCKGQLRKSSAFLDNVGCSYGHYECPHKYLGS